jgi:hypothetical protein
VLTTSFRASAATWRRLLGTAPWSVRSSAGRSRLHGILISARVPSAVGADVERASDRLDPDALRRQTDVPVREGLARPVGREAAAVVGDDESQLAAVGGERDLDLGGFRVLDDVREELARGRVEELLLRDADRVLEVKLQRELARVAVRCASERRAASSPASSRT